MVFPYTSSLSIFLHQVGYLLFPPVSLIPVQQDAIPCPPHCMGLPQVIRAAQRRVHPLSGISASLSFFLTHEG